MPDTPNFGRTPIRRVLAVSTPGDSATDYVIVVGDSIAKIYKWMPGEHAERTIEQRSVLQNLGQTIGR
jgi:hypothetical protein